MNLFRSLGTGFFLFSYLILHIGKISSHGIGIFTISIISSLHLLFPVRMKIVEPAITIQRKGYSSRRGKPLYKDILQEEDNLYTEDNFYTKDILQRTLILQEEDNFYTKDTLQEENNLNTKDSVQRTFFKKRTTSKQRTFFKKRTASIQRTFFKKRTKQQNLRSRDTPLRS